MTMDLVAVTILYVPKMQMVIGLSTTPSKKFQPLIQQLLKMINPAHGCISMNAYAISRVSRVGCARFHVRTRFRIPTITSA